MNEPKEYTAVIQELNPPGSINITTTEVFRADDPAIVQALKDSEEVQELRKTLAKLKELFGDDATKAFEWKRSHEAMEKLERVAISSLKIVLFVDQRCAIIKRGELDCELRYTAPTLISAIEQIPVKE